MRRIVFLLLLLSHLAVPLTLATSSPPAGNVVSQDVSEETASGSESHPAPAAVEAAIQSVNAAVVESAENTTLSTSSSGNTTTGGSGELKAPAPAAPVNAESTEANVQSNVHSVVSKVLSIISTKPESAHDRHRAITFKPVCTPSPRGLRFCSGIAHATYRHNEDVPFDLLDYNAHKAYGRLVEHIEYTVEQAPRADHCKAGYKEFLCAREFPHCCDIRVCGDYGPAPVAAGAQYAEPGSQVGPLVADARNTVEDKGKHVKGGKDATVATFLANGTFQINQDEKADNSTVLVKLHARPCLAYNLTYTPLFDCTSACMRTLTHECREMLHTSCEELCTGVAHPKCATKQLLAVAHGHSDGVVRYGGGRGVGVVSVLAALLVGVVLLWSWEEEGERVSEWDG